MVIESGKSIWKNLVIGIIFVFVAIVAFRNPAADLLGIVLYFTIAAIIKGGLEIMAWKKSQGLNVFIGIVDLFIGIFFLFHLAMGIAVSPFVFAIWFISNSIYRLVSIGRVNEVKYKWLIQLLNIVALILGVLLFFNPVVSAFTLAYLIALNLLIVGVLYLVSVVSRFF